MPRSAVLKVMVKAAYRAGRSLKRDLGEIENLQVSMKGPRNFVTAADRRAEEIVHGELAKARPDYGFLGEPDDQKRIGDGLSVMQWVGLLTGAGFGSIDILLRDAEKVVVASVKP